MDTNLKRICLNQSVLDFMNSKLDGYSFVLELGGGYSSRWFADRCGQLVVIETNAKWRRIIEQELAGADCHTSIYPTLEQALGFYGFDLALVDCDERLRQKAAMIAWRCLESGGWLIFDDAQRERHNAAIEALTEVAGDPLVLLWQPGDIETARERVALAWQKS